MKGDKIVSIDGAAVESRRDVVRAIRAGAPRKVVVIARGEEELETILDWADDPDEPRRQERDAEREAARAARKAERAAKRDAEKKAKQDK